jgi:glycosyltransferase involved in cell wall biosynthesis
MEEGKNLPLLVEYAQRYIDEGNRLQLVAAGTGSYKLPDHPDFKQIGFVSELDKARLYRQALALCQPSVNESFSLTMMESWLANRPALVHSQCSVTRGHVNRSKGGLWFETYGDFRGALDWFREHPDKAKRMAENGREYVQKKYTWPVIVDGFLALMRRWGLAP